LKVSLHKASEDLSTIKKHLADQDNTEISFKWRLSKSINLLKNVMVMTPALLNELTSKSRSCLTINSPLQQARNSLPI